MPRVSDRGVVLNQSPIRSLIPYARAAKARGIEVLHLNIGQPDIHTPPQGLDIIRQDDTTIVSYGPSEGLPALRSAVCQYYSKYTSGLSQEDVYVTTGASEAIQFALMTTCNEGDEIIVPEPFYANYIGFAQACSVTIVPATTTLEEQFSLPSPEVFAKLITAKTKAIFLCNPGNPTGKLYDREELASILSMARQHDLFVIVDEVYKEFCYDLSFTSCLSFDQYADRVVVIDSVSKLFSACGARVGFLITRNEAIKAAVIKYAQLRLCPPYHGQILAQSCYELGGEYIVQAVAEYRKRRQILHEGLAQIPGLKSYLPDAAFYNVVELPVENTMDFCRWLLAEYDHEGKTVMLAPAAGFYHNQELGRRQVRIAYVLNGDRLRAALNILSHALEAYASRHQSVALG